jgi:ABC-type lipopolysaccharide export system ATPase subunit
VRRWTGVALNGDTADARPHQVIQRTDGRGVNVEIASGEVIGLGTAGKTTTFSMVVGLTAPGLGRVLDGIDVNDPMANCTQHSYLPVFPSSRATVEQNIMAILETIDPTAAGRRGVSGNCWPS